MLNRVRRTGWYRSWKRWNGKEEEIARRWRDNMKKCSCWMCGNQRRHFGQLPIQEKRIHMAAEADFSETFSTKAVCV
jgi:hypothetical protein